MRSTKAPLEASDHELVSLSAYFRQKSKALANRKLEIYNSDNLPSFGRDCVYLRWLALTCDHFDRARKFVRK